MAKTNDEQTAVATEQTSAKKLKALMRVAEAVDKDMKSISGGYGEQIARAIQLDHLHKQAWSRAVWEKKQARSPEKYAAYREALDWYREATGLDEIAASAPRLPMTDESGKEDDDNVHDFPPAVRA